MTVGGRELAVENEGEISGDEHSIRLPRRCKLLETFDDRLLVLVYPESNEITDPDIEVPEDRNVVAITPDCTHAWTVESLRDPDTEQYYRRSYLLGSRVILRSKTGHFYEIDPETGERLADWPETEFQFADRTVSFAPAEVGPPEWYDGKIIFRTSDSMMYGFEPDGTKLWERETEADWHLEAGEEKFGLWIEPRMGMKMEFRLDTETGKIVEQTYGAGVGEKYVDE
ncbi:hypothetical protein [Halorientalis sp. IM1011]|uniref:hypothetical protein n=1 Tax=Halorientalis sp. IM1011 TaxID=1932360 RepID=UPI0012F94B4C|nr:hypothetical protein [Halorientalis sp. IM1011]